jgi:S1-C subfamily serine protease
MCAISKPTKLLLVGVLRLLASSALLQAQDVNTPSQRATNVSRFVAKSPPVAELSDFPPVLQPREIAERILPSTVLLVMQDAKSEPLALGSGFVVGDGKVVSNFHVIEGASAGLAKLVGKKGNVEISGVLAKNEAMDLVLLSVPGITANAVRLSPSKAVAIGDPVYACGNPIGLEGTFSSGIVSGYRELGSNSLLQITSPISPGSSGGPVANQYGAVVGVTVATYTGGQNLNLAIPADFVIDLLNAHQELQGLAKVTKAKGAKSLFSNLGAENATSGIVGESFLWDVISLGFVEGSHADSGSFTFTLRNRTKQTVKNITGLAIIYGNDRNAVDFEEFTFQSQIPPGLAKRMTGAFAPSVKPLTTKPISKEYGYLYSRTPSTKVEFRILSFDVEE